MIDYHKNQCAVLFFIILLCNLVSLHAATSEEWFRATSSGDTAAIVYLISNKANINERGVLSMTPLMLASFFGKAEAVRILINAQANVNLKSGSGLTALMLASQKGFDTIVSLLLNAGADKNSKSTSGTTALMYAKEKGFEAVIHQINAHTKQILSLVPDKEYTIDTMLEKQPAKRTQTAPADAKPVVSDNRLGSPPATYSTEFSSAVKQIDSQQIQQRQTHIPGEKHIEQTNNDFLQQSDIQTDSSDNNKSSEMSLIPGVWLDPENNNNTRYSIKRINGEPRVVAAANNKEIFTVEKSLWSNGILTWEYLVPSTDFRLTYKTIDIKSDNVICSWSNDHGMSGTVVLKNMHQNFESDTIMAITKDTSRTGINTGKGIVKPLALNNTYKAIFT